jgi:exodeoxyribonuclease VII large subunit
MLESNRLAPGPRVWGVGALCRAVADTLDARFNPVTVRGELTGFSRAASGHCYFSLKDASGQIRCAMFRRAASLLDFSPRDGELVEVRGRLGVYEQRGDLQLVAESMTRAGQGNLFEQFLLLKAKLEAEGLFEAGRKRALPLMPRAIGLVTSLGAAALHDVVTALQRRVPHIPVVLAPASVQGANAPGELAKALSNLYLQTQQGRGPEVDSLLQQPPIDVILLVRGGGALEDLWAFNDEQLARTIAQSPVPVISGVGHETDFTIADFVADLRAPTPTAAAELVSASREVWLGAVDLAGERLREALERHIDRQSQRLDMAANRLGRPSRLAARQHLRLANAAQRLDHATLQFLKHKTQQIRGLEAQLPLHVQRGLARRTERLARAGLRLEGVDPQRVLQRGFAWLTDASGAPVTGLSGVQPGQALTATLADGALQVDVTAVVPKPTAAR